MVPAVPAFFVAVPLLTATAASQTATARQQAVQAMKAAAGHVAAGRFTDALTESLRATELAPDLPAGWYAFGHAYNAIAREAMATFGDGPDDATWKQLLVADRLLTNGQLTDAFVVYRATGARLPAMGTIHDSIARIYEQTGHPDWAARERAKGVPAADACATRVAFCEFRAGRHRAALAAALAQSDAESRYLRARAATELALSALTIGTIRVLS